MTKGTRRGLFYGLIALFLIIGTTVILYSEGWRLNLQTRQISKIGAIYVRSYPEGAAIFVNGKPVENKSGFLSPGTLISDLFPATYAIKLTASGYDAWHENVAVEPSLVAQLKYAVLVPQDATSSASGTVQRFFATQEFTITQNLVEAIAVNGKSVARGTLMDATTDNHAFLFEANQNDLRLYDAINATTTDLSAIFQKDGIAPLATQDVILDPNDGSQIFIIGQNKIWALDLDQQSLTLIEKAPVSDILSPTIAINDSMIAWTRFASASNTAEIMLYNRADRSLRETSTTLTGATQQLAWVGNSQLGVLQSDGSLYLYNSSGNKAQKIASDVKDFSASADGTMVAALEHTSTEIFTLNDATGYYRFNLPNVQNIQGLIWYKDDEHLFVAYPDHASFLDLQDLGLNNFITVTAGTSPSYDANTNAFYFISPSNQLMQLAFPD